MLAPICAIVAGVWWPASVHAGRNASTEAQAAQRTTPVAVVELHYLMATPVLIAARAANEEALRAGVHAAFAEIRRLGDVCSNFDSDSEVNRLNRLAGTAAVAVEPDLLELLRESRRLSLATRGAFSITVGPLVDLWKQASAEGIWPSQRMLAGALDRSRPEDLLITSATVQLVRSGMRLELGGIAKGFAADRALSILRAAGADAGLVNLGGSSIAAFGDAGPERRGWPVELGDVSTRGAGLIWLEDAALSASETFGRVSRIGSRKVGHLIDPRSGVALTTPSLAIVRHGSATTAEALSKAVIVLGQREGFPVAKALHAEAMLVAPGGKVACTERFAERAPCGARIDHAVQEKSTSRKLADRNPEATLTGSLTAKRIPR